MIIWRIDRLGRNLHDLIDKAQRMYDAREFTMLGRYSFQLSEQPDGMRPLRVPE